MSRGCRALPYDSEGRLCRAYGFPSSIRSALSRVTTNGIFDSLTKNRMPGRVITFIALADAAGSPDTIFRTHIALLQVARSPVHGDYGSTSIEAARMHDTFRVPLADGLHLECRALGSLQAPVVLFLHGFPEGPGIWDDLMETLEGRFRCVAPDLRVYGSDTSLAIETSHSGQLADDIGLLVQSLDVPLAALVAHDWGGSLAWTLAAQTPVWLRHLEIVNSPQAATVQGSLEDTQQRHASAYMDFLCRPEAQRLREGSDFDVSGNFSMVSIQETANPPKQNHCPRRRASAIATHGSVA